MKENTKRLVFLILIFVVVYLPFLETSGWDLINKQAWDFPSFYYAAETAFDLGLTPYTQENWATAETLYDGTLYAFLYVPPAILLFRPLNFIPFETAKLLMLGLNHILTLLIIWLLLIKVLKRSHLETLFAAGIVLFFNFAPLAATIRLGQVNLIVLVLLLLAWLGLKEDWHPAATGASLAFATILKFNPAIFLVYLALKRKWRSLAWALGILAVAVLLSFILLPAATWPDWIANVVAPGFGEPIRGQHPASTSLQGVNAFAARLFIGRDTRITPLVDSPLLGKLVPYILALIVTLPILYYAYRNKAKTQSDRVWDLEFALYLTVMFLVTPLAWDNHLVFLLPPIFVALALLIEDWPRLPRRALWAALLIASIAAISYPFPFNLPAFRSGLRSLIISNKFYGVMLIWLFLTLRSAKSPVSNNQ